jgi:hypothetical protein
LPLSAANTTIVPSAAACDFSSRIEHPLLADPAVLAAAGRLARAEIGAEGSAADRQPFERPGERRVILRDDEAAQRAAGAGDDGDAVDVGARHRDHHVADFFLVGEGASHLQAVLAGR